jgi:hypothetical protein
MEIARIIFVVPLLATALGLVVELTMPGSGRVLDIAAAL